MELGGLASATSVYLGVMPSLRTLGTDIGRIYLRNNTTLARVDMRALATVGGDIEVTQAPMLARCLVERIIANLINFTGTVTLDGLGLGECPAQE